LEKRKLLLVTHSLNIFSGAESDFERLLKYYSLKKEQYSVDVVIPSKDNKNIYQEYCNKSGYYKWGYLPFSRSNITDYIKYFLKGYLQFWQIYKFISKSSYDIAVLNVSVLVWPLLTIKLKKIKCIVFIREIVEPKFVRKLLYKLLYYFADYFIAISDEVKRNFCYITNAKNIDVIKTAIEDYSDKNIEINYKKINKNVFSLLKDKNVFKVVTVGPVSENKNQLLQVKTLKLIKQYYPGINIKWFCIGSYKEKDHYYKSLKKYLIKNNLENSYYFLGELIKTDVYGVIKESDSVVITSLKEGFSIVMLESFMFKKPLVSSPVADVPDIIVNNRNGFIINYSENAIAEVLISIYNDSDLAVRIGEEGFKTFKQINNISKNLLETETVINSI
jgi:glycosyltransferase involved in cell wall biosynthesis